MIAHHVVACPRQFVGERLGGERTVSLCAFTLIEPVRGLVIANDAVGGLNKRPGEIGIAVLAVVFALLFAVAQAATAHAPAIRGEPTNGGKTADITGLERDGQAEDVADPMDSLEPKKFGRGNRLGLHGCLQGIDLRVERLNDSKIGLDRSLHVSIFDKLAQRGVGLLNPFAGNFVAG